MASAVAYPDHHRPPPDRQIPHPGRAPILGSRDRPAPWASHQISGGLHEQLQLTTGISRGQHDKSIQSEQCSRHRPGSVTAHLGLLHGRDRLVVITDRESPRHLDRSTQPGVSPRFPHPLPALQRSPLITRHWSRQRCAAPLRLGGAGPYGAPHTPTPPPEPATPSTRHRHRRRTTPNPLDNISKRRAATMRI